MKDEEKGRKAKEERQRKKENRKILKNKAKEQMKARKESLENSQKVGDALPLAPFGVNAYYSGCRCP